MNTHNLRNGIESEREAVKRNMERATETTPAEFRDEANESKAVSIGEDVTNRPIHGIDPDRLDPGQRAGRHAWSEQ